MDEAWFGLIGVVVGGVISTVWAWLAVVREELSDAMVAARLVDEELGELQRGLEADDHPSDGRAGGECWAEHRAALARVLGRVQWEAVSAAYHAPGVADVRRARAELRPLVEGKR